MAYGLRDAIMELNPEWFPKGQVGDLGTAFSQGLRNIPGDLASLPNLALEMVNPSPMREMSGYKSPSMRIKENVGRVTGADPRYFDNALPLEKAAYLGGNVADIALPASLIPKTLRGLRAAKEQMQTNVVDPSRRAAAGFREVGNAFKAGYQDETAKGPILAQAQDFPKAVQAGAPMTRRKFNKMAGGAAAVAALPVAAKVADNMLTKTDDVINTAKPKAPKQIKVPKFKQNVYLEDFYEAANAQRRVHDTYSALELPEAIHEFLQRRGLVDEFDGNIVPALEKQGYTKEQAENVQKRYDYYNHGKDDPGLDEYGWTREEAENARTISFQKAAAQEDKLFPKDLSKPLPQKDAAKLKEMLGREKEALDAMKPMDAAIDANIDYLAKHQGDDKLWDQANQLYTGAKRAEAWKKTNTIRQKLIDGDVAPHSVSAREYSRALRKNLEDIYLVRQYLEMAHDNFASLSQKQLKQVLPEYNELENVLKALNSERNEIMRLQKKNLSISKKTNKDLVDSPYSSHKDKMTAQQRINDIMLNTEAVTPNINAKTTPYDPIPF